MSCVKPQSRWNKACFVVLTFGSCVAARCLWVHVTHGLQSMSILQVSGWFTCSMCCSATIIAAIGIFVACENLANNQHAPQGWTQILVSKIYDQLAPTVLTLLDACEQSERIQSITKNLAEHIPISWLLSMVALASLFYHLVKTIYLGVVTQCFYNWSLTPQALWVLFTRKEDFEEWIQTNYRSMTPNQKDLPMAPDIELPWPISIALFLMCVGVSIKISRWFYKEPTTGTDGEQPDTETEISDSEQPDTAAEISDTRGETIHGRTAGDETARRSEPLHVGLASDSEQPDTVAEISDTRGETSHGRTAGDETVRRSEFLYVGLGHWFITFIRRKMEQQAMPHNFNLFNLPIGGNLTDATILDKMHHMLNSTYGLQMPTDDFTIFDPAYLAWDKFSAIMLFVEGWALVMVLLATLLQTNCLQSCGRMCCCRPIRKCYCMRSEMVRLWCSRCCVLCAAVLAGSAGLLQLLPNYIAALGLDPYYEGCGTSYDAYMKLLLNVVFGSAISALLGWKLLSNLLTLPISLVRGIWLFLLDEKDADVRSNLSCLMRYLAVIMPLINGFPLLFVSQLTESRRVWQPLLGFWLLPQLWITSRTDSSFVQWSFYPIWLCLYLGFFSWFVFSQIEVLNLNIWKTLQELDWPYVWSLLHAEFCIMNVLVTDVLELILRSKKVQ